MTVLEGVLLLVMEALAVLLPVVLPLLVIEGVPPGDSDDVAVLLVLPVPEGEGVPVPLGVPVAAAVRVEVGLAVTVGVDDGSNHCTVLSMA